MTPGQASSHSSRRPSRSGRDALQAIAGPVAGVDADSGWYRSAEVLGVMRPPQPQFSLPMPRNWTFHGLARPFVWRSLARSVALERHVLDPVRHLLRRAAPDVGGDVGIGPDLLAEVEELVGPEALSSTTPPQWMLTRRGRLSAGPTPSCQWY